MLTSAGAVAASITARIAAKIAILFTQAPRLAHSLRSQPQEQQKKGPQEKITVTFSCNEPVPGPE
jgi:hypothetical protein